MARTPRTYQAHEQQALEWMAAQIRQARQNSGYSQEELAARANLSRSHISKIESAQYDPQFTTLLRLTTALKLSMQDLLRGNG